MKIGIITQPLCHNYGGTLQNFALQQILRDMGHQPVTLNLDFESFKEKLFLRALYCFRAIIGSYKKNLIYVPRNVRFFEQHFRNFEKENINILRLKRNYVKQSDIVNNGIEALIVGSDQTWRKDYNPGDIIYNMFLDFAENLEIPKISYAASFGHDKFDFNIDETIKIKRLLSQFDAVSVRENIGKDICNAYFNINATVVLDPTLLVNQNVYAKIADTAHKNDGIAVYFLDPTPQKLIFAENICRLRNKQMWILGRPDKLGVYPSIESWLSDLKNADFIITDSFHGTVFSIIFQKKFYSIANTKRGLSRIKTLCDSLGLQDRILDVSELSEGIIDGDIEWTIVSDKLKELKIKSLSFLEMNLKKGKRPRMTSREE